MQKKEVLYPVQLWASLGFAIVLLSAPECFLLSLLDERRVKIAP